MFLYKYNDTLCLSVFDNKSIAGPEAKSSNGWKAKHIMNYSLETIKTILVNSLKVTTN